MNIEDYVWLGVGVALCLSQALLYGVSALLHRRFGEIRKSIMSFFGVVIHISLCITLFCLTTTWRNGLVMVVIIESMVFEGKFRSLPNKYAKLAEGYNLSSKPRNKSDKK